MSRLSKEVLNHQHLSSSDLAVDAYTLARQVEALEAKHAGFQNLFQAHMIEGDDSLQDVVLRLSRAATTRTEELRACRNQLLEAERRLAPVRHERDEWRQKYEQLCDDFTKVDRERSDAWGQVHILRARLGE